jgi:hypothetical protein
VLTLERDHGRGLQALAKRGFGLTPLQVHTGAKESCVSWSVTINLRCDSTLGFVWDWALWRYVQDRPIRYDNDWARCVVCRSGVNISSQMCTDVSQKAQVLWVLQWCVAHPTALLYTVNFSSLITTYVNQEHGYVFQLWNNNHHQTWTTRYKKGVNYSCN